VNRPAQEFVKLIHRNSFTPVVAYLRSKFAAQSSQSNRFKYLEIEDLVSKASERSKGYGSELFDWLTSLAVQQGCRQVRLVSNVRREDAHRFYLRKGMSLEAHYFSINVSAA
jgi:GNAT superfamily N-acetyltransferase